MLKNSHRIDLGECISVCIKKLIPCMLFFILSILIIKGILSDFCIKAFSIDTDKGVFWILSKLSKVSIVRIDLLWVLFGICLTILLTGFYLKAKDYYKNKLLIIEHSSFNAMNFKIDEANLKDYSYNKLVLNQFETMEKAQSLLSDRIAIAIMDQIDFLKQIRKFVTKGYGLAYLGIAHTPLIFLLGFLVGDENNVKLFHKRRDDANDDKFHLLSSINYSESLSRQCDEFATKSFNTVLLCIETTFKITDDDIKCIRNNNDYVLRYATANKGYEVIYSAKQINEYVKMIKDDLHSICISNHVKKIKICIASSVAFTFALAQSFSANHDPEIEVFHYDTKNVLKYSWGINITKKKAIITGVGASLKRRNSL